MPRETVVEDEEDAVPLSELLRTGEASRLRRRGAMRAPGHRRDDEDQSALPLHRRLILDEVHLDLSCGVSSTECSLPSAGPSRPSPLPRLPSARQPSDVGFILSSTGCGAQISIRALPASSAGNHIYISTELTSSVVARLPSKYLDPEQRILAESLTKEDCGCQCEWDAIGCRVCGNVLGFLYAPCHPRHNDTQPTYVFFSSSVTSSPDFAFPPIQPRDESDEMSIDSPIFSPHITRHFRSDDEFWRPETNLPSWASWVPDPRLMPTPPRSPVPAVATPLAFTAWQTPTSAPVPPQPSRTAEPLPTPPTPPETLHRDSTHPASPGGQHMSPEGAYSSDWHTYFRTRRITESRSQPGAEATRPEEPEVPPLPHHTRASHSHRDRGSSERERAPDRLGLMLIGRSDSSEGSNRHGSMDPPALHRMTRRPFAPAMRRPTSFEWRGRHINPDATIRSTQGSEERMSRGSRSTRRISVPVPAPAPAFTLLDSAGERSYPPSASSSFDVRDTLGVSVETETDEDGNVYWLRHESEPPTRARAVDRENEEVGEEDSEEKDEDLDERRVDGTPDGDDHHTAITMLESLTSLR